MEKRFEIIFLEEVMAFLRILSSNPMFSLNRSAAIFARWKIKINQRRN